MDDGEGPGIGVVDAGLLGRQLVLDQLVFDAGEREGTGGVEAERAQIAREHFHGRDATALDRFDKLGACPEREILAAPEAETLGIGKIMHRGRAGGRHIDDAGLRQRMLQAKAGPTLLGRGDVSAFALAASRVGHRMRLVENDHSVELRTQPLDDLLDPGNPLSAGVGS